MPQFPPASCPAPGFERLPRSGATPHPARVAHRGDGGGRLGLPSTRHSGCARPTMSHPGLPRLAHLGQSRALWTVPLVALALTVAAQAGDHRANATSPLQAPRVWTRSVVWAPTFEAGSMLRPQGLAVGAGKVYVVDQGHDRLAVLDASGAVVSSIGRRGFALGELLGPRDVAVDSGRDRVYVADTQNRRIAVFTLAGAPVAEWLNGAPGAPFAPIAVAVNVTNGNVYVLRQRLGGRVDRFAADGQYLGGWSDQGGGAGPFVSPEDIAVHPDGRVFVADAGSGRLEIFAADGTYGGGLAGLNGLHGVAVDPADGRIYALHDSPNGLADRIVIYGSNGTPQQELRSEDFVVPWAPANAIAIGPGSRLIVSGGLGSTSPHGVRQYDTSLAQVASTLSTPKDSTGFVQPTSLDVAPNGDVFAMDNTLGTTAHLSPLGVLAGQVPDATGSDLALGPGGELYLADALGAPGLRQVSTATGQTLWEKPCDCFNGVGLAFGAGRLFVTSALSHTVPVFDTDPSHPAPVASFNYANPPGYAWPVDVDHGPGGALVLADGDGGGVAELDGSTGSFIRRWAVGGGGAERLSVGADGTVFVLAYDGSVAAYRPDGSLESSWTPAPVGSFAVVRPVDLAAGPNGRVYVADAFSGSIMVYDAVPAPPTATPTPVGSAPCRATGAKSAAPGRIPLGDAVTVTLSLDITCQAGRQTGADIMLIIDRSNSMAGTQPRTKMYEAKAAANAFVDRLDFARHRVGLVSFSDIASLDQPLTANAALVHTAIGNVQTFGSTDIAAALDRALWHLDVAGRPDAEKVILLLTDGNPTRRGQPYVDTVRQAARARARGVLVYAIGLGVDVDQTLLTAVAGSTDRYFDAPQPEELQPIYQQLSRSVGSVVARDVVLTDTLGADVDLVAGTASGNPTLAGKTLTWRFPTFTGATTLTLQVRPTRLGRVPTNTSAEANFLADGIPVTYRYPVPEVEVFAPPTATAVPSPTPTRVPSRPGRIYLPIALRNACSAAQARLGADVVLVVDTSSSMTGDKLAAAKAAAKAFLFLLDTTRDRVGMVSFNDIAKREATITSNFNAVAQKLDGLTVSPGSRVDLGLVEARKELIVRSRSGSQRVAILLSDGLPTEGFETAAQNAAADLKALKATLFTIGLGADANSPYLAGLATSPSHYHFSPDPGDLADVYRRIAANLPCR